jgi:ubiquinone/menaquinone biosynthesis C-methylase UbiE
MNTNKNSIEEQNQAELFDRIASEYEQHYSDKYSQRYRALFYNTPLIEGLNLSGKRVLEGMCGSGQTTQFLLSKGAEVVGLDISEQMINSFKRSFPNNQAVQASMLDTKLEEASFDYVIIVGSLHHLQPHVQAAIDEVFRLLKPGGYFCFIEPHSGSLPDLVRKLWYKLDKHFFEENESSIDFNQLAVINAQRFEVCKTKYLGNIAYILVLNTLILRMPKKLKRLYTPTLLRLEAFISKFQNKTFSCFIVGQWRKKTPSQ